MTHFDLSIRQIADSLSDTLTQEHFTQMQEIQSKTYKHGKTRVPQLKKFKKKEIDQSTKRN